MGHVEDWNGKARALLTPCRVHDALLRPTQLQMFKYRSRKEMAQLVQVLATKPENLSSIPSLTPSSYSDPP